MKINYRNESMFFSELPVRQVFKEVEGNAIFLYMKVHEELSSDDEYINAVCLDSGILVSFNETDKVRPVQTILTVETTGLDN